MTHGTNVYFAEKQNGEIIELTEIEALTHFEQNNVAQRMRLKFLGTSDGSEYKKARRHVQEFLADKRKEDIPEYYSLDPTQAKQADNNLRQQYASEIKAMVDEGYEKELANARQNGVKHPDRSLRVVTTANGKDPATGAMRQKILSEMGGRI